jgi:MFS family permease
MMQIFKHQVYGIQFWLLCFSSFLFFASFNMIIPELPNYLSSLGGEDYKGLIIALFTLTAGLSRPFSGKLADRIGRVPMMVFGAVVCFACGFFYPILSSVAGFLFLRFVHGFSTGFQPTGTAAYIADIVPVQRRGEAMGLLGLCGSLGMAGGPAVGAAIAQYYTLNVMFYASSVVAMLSLLVLGRIRETLPDPERFKWRLLKVSRREVFEPRVLAPSIVMLLTAFSFGVMLTIIPDFSEHLGMENKGLFFTCFTVASLAVRILAGRASDRYGRVPVLRLSTFTLMLSMISIGLASSPFGLLLAAVLFGVGNGMNSPTVFAWTVDLSQDEHRGRAVATMYIALEMGIGLGALLSGWWYGNNPAMIPVVFWMGAMLCLGAFLYLFSAPARALAKAGFTNS